MSKAFPNGLQLQRIAKNAGILRAIPHYSHQLLRQCCNAVSPRLSSPVMKCNRICRACATNWSPIKVTLKLSPPCKLQEHLCRTAPSLSALRLALTLLRDIQERAASRSSTQAIREAYVNYHGGFALDVPHWLERYRQQDGRLSQQQASHTVTRARESLWRKVLIPSCIPC